MRYELRLNEPCPVGNVRGLFILARFSLTFCPENDISASKLIGSLRSIFCEEELHEALQHLRPGSSLFRRASVPRRWIGFRSNGRGGGGSRSRHFYRDSRGQERGSAADR